MQIFTPIGARYLSWEKIHIFPHSGLPWTATISRYTFLQSSCRADVMHHLTCNLNYHLQDIHRQNLGFWGTFGVPLKGEKHCLGPISTILQNFTSIGGITTEISIFAHTKKPRNKHRANLISDKMLHWYLSDNKMLYKM